MVTATSAATTASRQLAEYSLSLRLEETPAEALDKAKLCILDTVGCMIAAAPLRVGRIITEHAARHGREGAAGIWGRAERVDTALAALANGTLAHVLELDDGHRPSDNHLGCVVVPAAMAAAETAGSDGRELIAAVIVGYDVMGRVGEAVCLPRLRTPFHGTGTTGGFGSVASAGRLMDLSAGQIANAFGIAGTSAAGLREVFKSGADCKPLHVGIAARNGIDAVLLAEAGLEGPAEILEGEHGFCGAMTPTPRPELLTDGLGERFAVLESGFKVHAACGMLFTPVDAALAVRPEEGVDPDEVEEVRVAMPGWVKTDSVFSRKRPPTVGTARFSVPYGVAAALVAGRLGPSELSDDMLNDERVAEVESRVVMSSDQRVEELFERTKDDMFFFYPSSVELVLKDGRRIEQMVTSPLGYDPNRALTHDQVIDKFRSVVEPVVGEDGAQSLIDWAMRLDEPGAEARPPLTHG